MLQLHKGPFCLFKHPWDSPSRFQKNAARMEAAAGSSSDGMQMDLDDAQFDQACEEAAKGVEEDAAIAAACDEAEGAAMESCKSANKRSRQYGIE